MNNLRIPGVIFIVLTIEGSMYHRVKYYYCHFLSADTGKMSQRKEEFEECQCNAFGIMLHLDGININDAVRLVLHWNRISGNSYTYSIPFCK